MNLLTDGGNGFALSTPRPPMPIELSGTYLFMLALLLAFVLGTYWYVRKILVNFRQGIDRGRR